MDITILTQWGVKLSIGKRPFWSASFFCRVYHQTPYLYHIDTFTYLYAIYIVLGYRSEFHPLDSTRPLDSSSSLSLESLSEPTSMMNSIHCRECLYCLCALDLFFGIYFQSTPPNEDIANPLESRTRVAHNS
jgi:hypothetical protein